MRHFLLSDNDTWLESMKLALPIYLAAATDVDSNIDPMLWWKQHSSLILNWSSALCQVMLLQPSSAAVQHAFSFLNGSVGAAQECALADYAELSLMV